MNLATPHSGPTWKSCCLLPAKIKFPHAAAVYQDCKVDEWALQEKERFTRTALQHLEDMSVAAVNKQPLLELADQLLNRGY